MGCIKSQILKYKNEQEVEDPLEEIEELSSIPDDEFLCPKCGEVPEIFKINTNNSNMKLKCKNCGEYDEKINDYYSSMKGLQSNYLNKCPESNSNRENHNIKYCYNCNTIFCEHCENEAHIGHKYINSNEKKINVLYTLEKILINFVLIAKKMPAIKI